MKGVFHERIVNSTLLLSSAMAKMQDRSIDK